MTNKIYSCKCGWEKPICFPVYGPKFSAPKFRVTCYKCYVHSKIYETQNETILDWNMNHTNIVIPNEYIRQNQRDILELAISTFGKENQINKAIEESCELGAVLAKRTCVFNPSTNEQIISEIADMQIMLEQLKMIFDDGQLFDKTVQKKLLRLGFRLKNSNKITKNETKK